jgi:hypothetical protein
MPHPDEGLIHAWLDGELDDAEGARVEALVESDAQWAAAAAEARGLIAASARIVGALDRVPANVIPKAAPARPASRRWVWRVAAVLALMAGSAVVLEHETPELPAPKANVASPDAKTATIPSAHFDSGVAAIASRAAGPQRQVGALPKIVAKKNPARKAELADAAPTEPARDKDAAAASADLGAKVAAAPSAQVFAPSRLTRLQPSCFAQREPADSIPHIIRLNAAELADSVQLETLVLRGDTLSAVARRFIAVRVRCPEP